MAAHAGVRGAHLVRLRYANTNLFTSSPKIVIKRHDPDPKTAANEATYRYFVPDQPREQVGNQTDSRAGHHDVHTLHGFTFP